MPNALRTASRYLAWFSMLLAATTAAMLLMGYRSQVGPLAVGTFAALALFCMGHPFLKRFAFTVWVFAFVAASMFYPQAFMTWGRFDLGILIVPLIQIIMFGMGTTLSVADFARVFKMPWPVFIGMVLQFSAMPLGGFAVASVFGFPPEIATGIILIGSCPGGVASNLMTYLANGDVALSVTMTSCSTLMSPVMTPFMMKVLAGRLVQVKFVGMMLSIMNMIIVPVLAGLIANRILYSPSRWANRKGPLLLLSVVGVATAIMVAVFWRLPAWPHCHVPERHYHWGGLDRDSCPDETPRQPHARAVRQLDGPGPAGRLNDGHLPDHCDHHGAIAPGPAHGRRAPDGSRRDSEFRRLHTRLLALAAGPAR